jgi:ABC-type transport system involved in multi-copper enzyme maturation permease subunit
MRFAWTARGNLTHLFVTDLSSAEIVLGKLAARLVPVFGLVAATIPVLAIAGLLGGVVFEAIVYLTLLTLALAVLGCSLAMAISVRAIKAHEVLMAVYAIEGVWILGPYVWMIFQSIGTNTVRIPQWVFKTNPYFLAWSPFLWRGTGGLLPLSAVLGGALAVSAGLILYAVLRIRAAEQNRSGVRGARVGPLARAWHRLTAWRRPALDDNPVLWREWRRGQPSRLAKVVWGAFVVLALAGTAQGVVRIADDYEKGRDFLTIVNCLQASFGLLLLSIAAPTVLAEERVRGSLDVLLASPLSTNRIVLAKWWGAFRVVPALALLPAIGTLCIAASDPQFARSGAAAGHEYVPLGAMDRVAVVALPVGLLLAQGAAITSVGLALATWVRRVGRAVAVSVACYGFFAFALVVLLETIGTALNTAGPFANYDRNTLELLLTLVTCTCPAVAQYTPLETFCDAGLGREADYLEAVIALLATLVFALVVLALTFVTFDRCLGRVPERPRRAPRPPRHLAEIPAPHAGAADVLAPLGACTRPAGG